MRNAITEVWDMEAEITTVEPLTPQSHMGPYRTEHAESEIREYWLIDPGSQHIEFLINHNGDINKEIICIYDTSSH